MRTSSKIWMLIATQAPLLAGAHPGHEPLIHEFAHGAGTPAGITSADFAAAMVLACVIFGGARWYAARSRRASRNTRQVN